MSKLINTVTGTINPEDMGKTLSHEHIFFTYPGTDGDVSMKHLTKDEMIEKALPFVKAAVDAGIKTFIDATPNDCGKDVRMLRKMSELTGVNIICSTGYYHEGPSGNGYWWVRQILGKPAEEIEELMLKETTEGIQYTDIKAGVIKLASSEVITDYERRFFIAGINVQKKTGLPIYTHTERADSPTDQLRLFLENGADPAKTVIGHMDQVLNIEHCDAVAKEGFFLGFDKVGMTMGMASNSDKADFFVKLLDKGYEDQLLLSQDFLGAIGGRPYTWPPAGFEEAFADYRFDYIPTGFSDLLKERGVSEETINKVMINNPAKLFG